jgi:lysophospholipase L1-like esterase
VRIILVGDSTVAPRNGWGQGFCAGLAPWAEATKKVAAEEGVPLLDLNSDSAAAVQRMGPAEANALAMAPPPPVPGSPAGQANGAAEPRGDPAAVFDYTHLGEKGAALFGRMVAGELLRAVPDLRPYVSR